METIVVDKQDPERRKKERTAKKPPPNFSEN